MKSSNEPPKNKDKTTDGNGEEFPSRKEEDFNFILGLHVEKMQKKQDQLEALMYRKDLREVGIARPYPVEWESTHFPEKYNPLKLESNDGKYSPN